MVVVVLTQQLILDAELRGQVVLLLLPPCLHSTCYGITVCEHIVKVIRCVIILIVVVHASSATCRIYSSQRQHVEVIVGHDGIAVFIQPVLIDTHVRHSVVCASQDVVAVVLVVGCEGHVDVAHELDAVADPIVQCGSSSETVQSLSYNRTCTLIVVGTDTESCLITTTGESNSELMFLTELLYLLHPVCIITVVRIYITKFCVVVQFCH